MNEFREKIKELISNNTLSHVYLLEKFNNNVDEEIIEIAKLIVSNFNGTISKDYLEDDIFVIYPDKGLIKKEIVLDLQQKISTKSRFNRRRVYIIFDADMMNVHASNSLLKFIEEPEENIIGILLVSDINNLLDTIVSRCQIYSLKPQKNNFGEAYELVNTIEKEKLNFLLYLDEKIMNIYNTREEQIKILKEIREIYYQKVLNLEDNFNESIRKIKIIDESIRKYDFNVNKYLIITTMIIKFFREDICINM